MGGRKKSEVLYSHGDFQIKPLHICGCNKEKLSQSGECGMCFAGKGEVVICSGEQDFFRVDINSKCNCGCEESGMEVLASLLTDADVRKWLPDELRFMRQPSLRKYFVAEGKVPVNLGCMQTLITLDGDDCSKKVTIQQFAKKFELPEWTTEAMKTMNDSRIDAALDAFLSLYLSKQLMTGATDRVRRLQDLYLSSVETMARTELYGFAFDREKHNEMVAYLKKDMEKIAAEIYQLAGGEKWNLDSSKETSNVLYEKMKLEVPKHYKSNKSYPSTSAEVLQFVKHPIAGKITSYRTQKRALVTLQGLESCVDDDGRIRTTFDSNNIHSGRISSENPNFHSLGKELVDGVNSVRSVMVASKGNVLLGIDYGQLEMRVMCELSGDPGLVKLFNSDTNDVFQDMATHFKGNVTRNKTKQLCYGLIYGMGKRRLAFELQISTEESQNLIDQYFALFPKLKAWVDEQQEQSKNLVTESYFGRKRALSDAQGGSKAPRQSINHKVQATAAELFRKALVDAEKAITGMSGKIVNQVHDEIVIEVPKSKAEECAKVLKKVMESVLAGEFKVKFPVKMKTGVSWGSLEDS